MIKKNAFGNPLKEKLDLKAGATIIAKPSMEKLPCIAKKYAIKFAVIKS